MIGVHRNPEFDEFAETYGEALDKAYLKRFAQAGYFAMWENNPWNPGTRYI